MFILHVRFILRFDFNPEGVLQGLIADFTSILVYLAEENKMDSSYSSMLFFTFQTLNVLNPMRESPQEVLEDTDLAGPLVFCLIFGGTLLLVSQ